MSPEAWAFFTTISVGLGKLTLDIAKIKGETVKKAPDSEAQITRIERKVDRLGTKVGTLASQVAGHVGNSTIHGPAQVPAPPVPRAGDVSGPVD